MPDFTQSERDALAHMLMRSLRGNWGEGRKARAGLLIDLAESGLSDYDSERVVEKAKRFKHGDIRDGRTFRYIYQDGPELSEQIDKENAIALVGHIPTGDLSWDATAIDREYDDA